MKPELIQIVGQALGAIFACVLLTIFPKVRAWLLAKIGKEKTEKLILLCKSFVEAAEQLLKKEDPTGEKRKEFVINGLLNEGYDITPTTEAFIEAAVLTLNEAQK